MHTGTAHKLTAALTGLFALAGTALADDKPVTFGSAADTARTRLSDTTVAQGENGGCHLMANFGAYEDYIASTIHPRLSAELAQLTRPHAKPDGTRFYMAESIDHGDLFHAHIMLPYTAARTGPGLNPAFTDTQSYYLQYHSFEYSHEFRPKWLAELRALNDPAIDTWLAARETAHEARLAFVSDFNNNQKENPALKAAADQALRDTILSTAQRTAFATLWHDNTPGAPETWQLEKRLNNLGAEQPQPADNIDAYRSIASTDDQFVIIDELHYGTHFNSVQIAFDDRAENPALAAVIARADSLGVDAIYNPDGRNLETAAIDPTVNWPLNNELYAAFTAAAAQGPKGNFFENLPRDMSRKNYLSFRWNGDYIFAHGYYNMDSCPAAPRPPALQ